MNRYLLIISLIISFCSMAGAQDYEEPVDYEQEEEEYNIDPSQVKTWDDVDFLYISWEDIKHKFVPEELKETTLLFETFTLDQYIDSMEAELSLYFYNQGIDTSVQLSSMDLGGYMDTQLKEVKTFRKKYGSRMHASNAEFVSSYTNLDEYRFVLKKHFYIDYVDPSSGAINASEEFYFYDRKHQTAYPIIKADYIWISLNI